MRRARTMVARVEAYLKRRRGVGFELRIEGDELLRFARWTDARGHRGPVTTDLALGWARSAGQATPLYRARRLEIVRCFARHQAALEPGTEIPPSGILGPAHRRTAPYIYSSREIARLLALAGRLRSPRRLRGRTYVALLGLLACTGLRISEALALDRTDLDLRAGVLVIRRTKFRKSRLVPLHPTATRALRAYLVCRDRSPSLGSAALFVDEAGQRPPYSTVRTVFRGLANRAIGATPSDRRRPRLHDLRHTFACQCLLRWYRGGHDVDHRMPALSTYLGHAKVSDTYWYLTGVPQLMAITARRFERFAHGRERP